MQGLLRNLVFCLTALIPANSSAKLTPGSLDLIIGGENYRLVVDHDLSILYFPGCNAYKGTAIIDRGADGTPEKKVYWIYYQRGLHRIEEKLDLEDKEKYRKAIEIQDSLSRLC